MPTLVDLYCKVCFLGREKRRCRLKMPFRQFYSSRRERIITSHRRIVLSLVDPSCDLLRSSSNAYTPGRESVEFLFTVKFLESMRKKTTQDITLANSAAAREKTKVGRKRETSHPDSSTQVLRPRRREAPHSYSDDGADKKECCVPRLPNLG